MRFWCMVKQQKGSGWRCNNPTLGHPPHQHLHLLQQRPAMVFNHTEKGEREREEVEYR